MASNLCSTAASYQRELSRQFYRSYTNNKEIHCLDLAIKHVEQAIQSATDDIEEEGYMTLLSLYLEARYNHLHTIDDLLRAMHLPKDFLEISSLSLNDDHLTWRCIIASRLLDFFERFGSVCDIEKAIDIQETTVSTEGFWDNSLINHAWSLLKRSWTYEASTKMTKGLQRLVDIGLGLESKKWPEQDRIQCLASLSDILVQNYKQNGAFDEHLNEAERLAREACTLCQNDAMLLMHHGYVLALQCDHLAFVADRAEKRREAVDVAERALALVGDSPEQRVVVLDGLVTRNREAYEVGLGGSFLDDAIRYGHDLVDILKPTDPHRRFSLQHIAMCLQNHAQRSGEIVFLDQAIAIYRRATVDSSNLSNGELAILLHNLSVGIQERYHTSLTVSDAQEALDLARRAFDLSSDSDPSNPLYATTLSNSLYCRYDRLQQSQDLDEAIHAARQALSFIPPSSPTIGMYLSNLSMLLVYKLDTTSRGQYEPEHMSLALQAVNATPCEDTRRIGYIHNLGRSILRHAEHTDLEEAMISLDSTIELARSCLTQSTLQIESAKYTTELAGRLMAKVIKLEALHRSQESSVLLEEALALYEGLLRNEDAPVLERIGAGQTVAGIQAGRKNWVTSHGLHQETIRLFPRLGLKSFIRQDMQYRISSLSKLTSLSSFAAFVSLAVGESPLKALHTLEAARGLTSGYFIDLRAETIQLVMRHPQLAERYHDLRDALSKPVEASTPSPSTDIVLNRRQYAEALAETVTAIRQIPGFENFQSDLTPDRVCQLASHGPLVCYNVTPWDCNAFVVTTSTVATIPLPLLLEEDVKSNVQKIIGKDRITKCNLADRARNNAALRSLLQWLWLCAVRPVLEHLGFKGEPSDRQLPRIWWITAGQLGVLPLHAAGSNWDTSTENTVSRVMSSYVSTLKMLSYTRQRLEQWSSKAQLEQIAPAILGVSMPLTQEPGWPALNTETEMFNITQVTDACKIDFKPLSCPSTSTVLREIPLHNVIHFACHGDADIIDPSNSSFVLHGGSEQPERLSAGQLSEYTYDTAWIAYLSACCTGQQYVLSLIEEGIHLGSAVQLAGFPAVIATLWEADDTAAAEVARGFYHELFQADSDPTWSKDVGVCLHKASKAFRTRSIRRGRASDDVISWAPFVHCGA